MEHELLPQESWLHTFSFLSPSDSQRVSLTCKLWNELWQDKALWKHFHHSVLGGKPRPPLLPKAWQKSVKETLPQLKNLLPQQRFEFAIRQGRTAIVSQMLAKDPSLLTLNGSSFAHLFDDSPILVRTSIRAALLMCVEERDNLHMLKLLWNLCHSPPPNPNSQQSQPPPPKTKVRACVKKLLQTGDEPMLRYLLSVSIEAQEYVMTNGVADISQYPLAFVVFLEEMGVDFSNSSLSKCLMNTPVALWLMDRANWSREDPGRVRWWQEKGMLREALRPGYDSRRHAARSVVKKLLEKGASSDNWQELLEDYAKRLVIDKKVLKWLLRKHEEAIGCKEENLAFYVNAIEKGDTTMLQYLIKIGATEVNHIHPGWGKTLLQVAVERGSKPMVESLLACGADLTIKAKSLSVITMAQQKGFDDLRNLLMAHSKNILRGSGSEKKKTQRKVGGDEEGGKDVTEKESEEIQLQEEGKVAGRKRKQRTPKAEKPLSEKRQEELRMEVRVLDLRQWLAEHDHIHKWKYEDILRAKRNGFTSFELKQVCKLLQLRPPAQRKEVLWQTILQYLEERQAVVSHEM